MAWQIVINDPATTAIKIRLQANRAILIKILLDDWLVPTETNLLSIGVLGSCMRIDASAVSLECSVGESTLALIDGQKLGQIDEYQFDD